MDGDLDGLGGRGGSSRLQGHPEDVSEREEGQNESRYGGGEAPQVPPRPSEAGRSVNTGPKGVIQDYKEAKQHLEAQRIAKAIQFERKMNALAVGEEKFEIKTVVKMNREENEEDEDSEEMDEEVEEILKEFKIKEIERIQNSM